MAPANRHYKDSGRPDLSAAVTQDLAPLVEESVGALGLGPRQVTRMTGFMQAAWLLGIQQAYLDLADLLETQEVGSVETPSVEIEFRKLMESATSVLDLAPSAALEAWMYFARARNIGIRFWESELLAALGQVKA